MFPKLGYVDLVIATSYAVDTFKELNKGSMQNIPTNKCFGVPRDSYSLDTTLSRKVSGTRFRNNGMDCPHCVRLNVELSVYVPSFALRK